MKVQKKQERLCIEIISEASQLLEFYQWDKSEHNQVAIREVLETLQLKIDEFRSNLGT